MRRRPIGSLGRFRQAAVGLGPLVGEEGEAGSLLEDRPGGHRMTVMHGVEEATLVVEEVGILDYHDPGAVDGHPLEVGHLGIFVYHHLVLDPSTHQSCSNTSHTHRHT